MWACVSCLDLIKNNQSKFRIDSNDVNNEKGSTSTTADFEKRLRELEVSVENKIEETVRAVIPRVMEQCLIPTMTKSVETSVESSVNKNVSKAWAETITGNDDFPALDDPQVRNAPIKPKVTLRNAVKEAVIEQKKDDLKRDSRLCNIIIYRATECEENSAQARAENEKKHIKTLLEAIEVEAEPTKITRLGKYDKTAESPRPIKVEFDCQQTQQKVMKNLPKLRDAPDHLNKLSVCYDLSEEERKQTKEMVELAKKKTQESTNYEFRVRGPPWNLEIKQFKKRI